MITGTMAEQVETVLSVWEGEQAPFDQAVREERSGSECEHSRAWEGEQDR